MTRHADSPAFGRLFFPSPFVDVSSLALLPSLVALKITLDGHNEVEGLENLSGSAKLREVSVSRALVSAGDVVRFSCTASHLKLLLIQCQEVNRIGIELKTFLGGAKEARFFSDDNAFRFWKEDFEQKSFFDFSFSEVCATNI